MWRTGTLNPHLSRSPADFIVVQALATDLKGRSTGWPEAISASLGQHPGPPWAGRTEGVPFNRSDRMY